MPGTPIFVISGRGWGHGVGMAQWGAYGFAKQGATYDEILAHYYRGTTLGPAGVSRVRVLLAQGRSQLSVSSVAPFTARDGLGQLWHLPAGSQTVGPGLRLKTTDFPQPQRVPGPVTFLPGSAPLRLGGRPYRGNFQVSVAGGALRAVNNVALEAYLYGSSRRRCRRTGCRSAQGAGGRGALVCARRPQDGILVRPLPGHSEPGVPGDRARVTVDDRGRTGHRRGGRPLPGPPGDDVLLLQLRRPHGVSAGDLADLAADAVPGVGRRPLRHALAASPVGPLRRHRLQAAGVMRARGKLADLRMDTGPSGRVESVTAVGEQGESTVTGSDLRRALKLRSTWFRIGVLSLAKPEAPVTYGKKISLSGVARSLPSVRLDQRQAGSTWQPVGPVSPGPGGAVAISAKPRVPTDFRLTSGPVRSTVAHVSVAPLVRFQGMPDAGRLRGYARPVFPGASVALQRFNGSSWRTVARATIDENGSFEATLNLVPGDYRARLAPGRGFVPGVSPTLKVGPA